MNVEARSEAGSEDLAGGLISENSTVDRPRSRVMADFHAAREQIAAAREKARAEGRPIRNTDVDEQLQLIDDGGPLDQGEVVGND